MVIVWGTKFYGKCDTVPGICYVATRFGYLQYLPLLPLGTYAIIGEEDDSFSGAKIPFSFKSFLLAWVRTALVLALIIGVVWTIVALNDRNPMSFLVPGAVSAGALAAMIATYKVGFIAKASYERARELGEHLGLNEQGMALIEVAYGYMSLEELQAQAAATEEASSVEGYAEEEGFDDEYGDDYEDGYEDDGDDDDYFKSEPR